MPAQYFNSFCSESKTHFIKIEVGRSQYHETLKVQKSFWHCLDAPERQLTPDQPHLAAVVIINREQRYGAEWRNQCSLAAPPADCTCKCCRQKQMVLPLRRIYLFMMLHIDHGRLHARQLQERFRKGCQSGAKLKVKHSLHVFNATDIPRNWFKMHKH